MTPIDLVLSRLDGPKPNGRDRWRCACPVCGHSNRSTLSIGVGDNGCVLLKCFKSQCGPDQIAAALGLDIQDLFPPPGAWAAAPKRRRLMSAHQALDLLYEEAALVWVVSSDIARGKLPDSATTDRVALAAARIGVLRQEVNQ